jgi:hypothetical protein
MKKLLILTSMLLTFMSANSQNIVLNEATAKYEMIIDVTAKTNNQNDNFDNIQEWLVTNYTNKYSSSKLSNKEKGKIIYGAAFETRIFPSKGLISFNYTIKLDKDKINLYVTDFAYTIIGQTLSAGVAINFESKGLAGKKRIIKETETKILEALTKLQL